VYLRRQVEYWFVLRRIQSVCIVTETIFKLFDDTVAASPISLFEIFQMSFSYTNITELRNSHVPVA
jgi:hypothetical protein